MAIATTLAIIGIAAAVSTAIQVKGQLNAGKAAKKAGEANAQVAEAEGARLDYNAEIAEGQADDAVARGREEVSRFRSQVRGLIGSQRAGYAGQNVTIGEGSAADVEADTRFLAELDTNTLTSNAAREARGFRQAAEDTRLSADIARRGGANMREAGKVAASAAKWNAAGTLVGTGASLALSTYGWRDSAQPGYTPDPYAPTSYGTTPAGLIPSRRVPGFQTSYNLKAPR